MDSAVKSLYPALEYLGKATAFVEDIREIIDCIPLFGDLSMPEIEALSGFMSCFGAPRNATLLTEGEPGNHLIVILTGKVSLIKLDSKGIAKYITEVGPGAMLGELSMVDGKPRFASCITREPTDFAVLTREAVGEILVSSPRLGNKLLLIMLQVMAGRLRDTGTKLLPYMTGTLL